MRTEILCISALRVASGHKVKLSGRKNTLNPMMVYSTDRSKTVVPVLVLLFFCFVVYSTRRFILSLAWCYFVLVFFSPLSMAITSLGEERANLSAFRTFVRFALVWFCLFPLSLGVWKGLWLVIVALPGLFSYLIFIYLFYLLFCCCCFSWHYEATIWLLKFRNGSTSWLL